MALLLPILLAACGGGSAIEQTLPDTTRAPPVPTTTPGPPIVEIVSADGLATLHLPEGALPAGVTTKDVHVVSLDPLDYAGGNGVEVVAVYELLPDGVILELPALLEFPVGAPVENAMYFAAHLSGDDIEFPPTELILEDSGELVMAVELSHFSEVPAFIAVAVSETLKDQKIVTAELYLTGGKVQEVGPEHVLQFIAFRENNDVTWSIDLHGRTLSIFSPTGMLSWARGLGGHPDARATFHQAIQFTWDHRVASSSLMTVEHLGLWLSGQGQHGAVATVFGFLDSNFSLSSGRTSKLLAECRADPSLVDAFARGAAMTRDEVVEYALSLTEETASPADK